MLRPTKDLTKDAMAEGIRTSCFVILFLSEGVLARPFVQFEIDQASGGDQVDALQQELERRGFSCWYDNKMQTSLLALLRILICSRSPCTATASGLPGDHADVNQLLIYAKAVSTDFANV